VSSPEEEFDIAGLTADGGGGEASGGEGVGARGGEDFREDAAVDFGAADDAALADVRLAGLELGLDEGDEVGGIGHDGDEGGEDEAEGDESEVGDDEGDGLGELVGLEVADVEAFHDDDTWVVAEGPGELAFADVQGVDAGGAALEEDVGEAAGGGAGVEADLVGGIYMEGVQGVGELEAAAGDVGEGFADDDLGIWGDEGGRGFGDEAIDGDLAGADEGLGALAGGLEAAAYERDVEALSFWSCRSLDRFSRHN